MCIRDSSKDTNQISWMMRGFIWAKNRGRCVMFYIIYFTPNVSIQDFIEKMDGLKDNILSMDGCKVVAGDFNARSFEWGMSYTDTQGRLILELSLIHI